MSVGYAALDGTQATYAVPSADCGVVYSIPAGDLVEHEYQHVRSNTKRVMFLPNTGAEDSA